MPVDSDSKEGMRPDDNHKPRHKGPTETFIVTLPFNLVDRARALFDQAVECLIKTGLDECDAAGVIDGWSQGLSEDADNTEEDEEDDE